MPKVSKCVPGSEGREGWCGEGELNYNKVGCKLLVWLKQKVKTEKKGGLCVNGLAIDNFS